MLDLKSFSAMKNVDAAPMTRQAYNNLRGWELPENEDGNDDGYITVDTTELSNVDGYDGYVSWTPKNMFDNQFYAADEHPVKKGDLCDFGSAIYLLEQGERVMRAGWNGKNMWLILIEADQYELKAWKYFNATEQLPFIAMKTADNKIVPWLASQTDMLCKDWTIA